MRDIKVRIKKNTSLVPPLIITRGSLGWLIFSLVLAISWHIPHTPIWALATVPVLLAWRYRLFQQKKPLPSRAIRVALTLAVFGGIVISYHSYLGRDPGITAVILLSTLKLFELKSQRDFMFVIILCYFLVFGIFLYDQTIQGLAFMVVAVILITAAVLRLNHGERQPVRVKFLVKSGFRFFLYAIPFMIVLFALFPRTSVPLWNLGQDSDNAGIAGFNDSVYPGQFAELAASDKTAFRVSFPDGNMPETKDLYFRGLVLWFTDGKGWFQGIMRPVGDRRMDSAGDTVIRQEITLDPHLERWLFALETPVVIPRRTRVLPGRIFQSNWPITRVIRYEVESALRPAKVEPLTEQYRRWSLQLPRDWKSPIIDLARKWRNEVSSDAEVVQAALNYFETSGFEYSLTPSIMDPAQPLEDFLFNKRKGFCEHYAAAFTLLMRAADIPARMIAGYQGGVYNSVGGYLVVLQSDAHAWAEVWLNDRWQRVDPTAVVAPERIQFGAESSRSLSNLGTLKGDARTEAAEQAMRKTFFERVARFFKDHWDNINIKWEVWIMTYDRSRQRDFLENIGLTSIGKWSLILMLLIIVPALFFLLSFLLKRRTMATDPLQKLYRSFYRKTAKKGIKPAVWEGPLDFQVRAVDAFPHKTDEIRRIIDVYIIHRYGKMPATKAALKGLTRMVRRFKLK
jgi:hypothetical protein